MRSFSSAWKSEAIRGAVAPGSELGLRTEYYMEVRGKNMNVSTRLTVRGMVTTAAAVRTKKGKNCASSS